MANTDEAGFSALNSQNQEYLNRLHYQNHAINQHRHDNSTRGTSGFQPNAWGCRQHQRHASEVSCEDSASHSGEEKCRQVAYYKETARSFSAAAAVAAVAAAAYISSSNAAANSGYYSDQKSAKYKSCDGEKAIRRMQHDNSAYEAGLPSPDAKACRCTMKSMDNHNAANAVSSVYETQPIPIYFPSGSGDILPASTSGDTSKLSFFINGTKSHNYEESHSSKSQSYTVATSPAIPSRKRADKPPAHVKKPLNAFMLFMKAMRPKVVAECTMKESAAINQILGRKWHALPHEEQAKFYELARKEKELHQRMHPGWSARDNYAYHAKRRKKRCLYRVYNNAETFGDQRKQSREGSPSSRGLEAIQGEKQAINLPASKSTALDNVFKSSAFNSSPFGIDYTACGDQSVDDKCGDKTGENVFYFGLVDRHQQQHQSKQPSLLNIQQTELDCSLKEDYKTCLPCSFNECIDSISMAQHFHPSTGWFLNNQHPELTHGTMVSGITSSWLHTHQQMEDLRQRQISKPNCLSHSTSYPYYNSNFDYRYTEQNPTCISAQKTPPGPLERDPSLKLPPSYESKLDPFHPGCKDSGCEYNSSAVPVYGFSPS